MHARLEDSNKLMSGIHTDSFCNFVHILMKIYGLCTYVKKHFHPYISTSISFLIENMQEKRLSIKHVELEDNEEEKHIKNRNKKDDNLRKDKFVIELNI